MDAESLNRMMRAAVVDAAARQPALSRDEHRSRIVTDRKQLRQALGLEPMPPRTDLAAETRAFDNQGGYRIEAVAFQSRPEVHVTGTLYLPEGEGPFPIVVYASGYWGAKRKESWAQAFGVSFALQGIAAFIIDAPGQTEDTAPEAERNELGSVDDPFLAFGGPAMGQYVWDLVRSADLIEERTDLDIARLGITGVGTGGEASLLAYVLDDRFGAAAIACAGGSLEVVKDLPAAIPGLACLGDYADIAALRAPSPILLMEATEDPRSGAGSLAKTAHKLRTIYGLFDEKARVRHQTFLGGADYNRRMRETSAAFFQEQLLQRSMLDYVAEPIPLTDGRLNPAEANTLPRDAQVLHAGIPAGGAPFKGLMHRLLEEPYPEPPNAEDRLIPWSKHGRVEHLEPAEEFAIHDAGYSSGSSGSIALPTDGVDIELAHLLGMSYAEVLAQILHLKMPGRPEGWEKRALGGDAVTAMIASVRTLVEGTRADEQPKRLLAMGPLASEVARWLKVYRPYLETHVSHDYPNWLDLLMENNPLLIQPAARYLRKPR